MTTSADTGKLGTTTVIIDNQSLICLLHRPQRSPHEGNDQHVPQRPPRPAPGRG
jgi:hypothetical protein